MDWQKYSFVIAAPNRVEIIKAMDAEKTPKQLVALLKKQDANVSRALNELTSEGILKLLTPDQKRGRIYALTAIGKEIREKVLKEK